MQHLKAIKEIADCFFDCRLHTNTGRVCTVIAPDMENAQGVSKMLNQIGVTNRIFKGHFTPHHYVAVHYG